MNLKKGFDALPSINVQRCYRLLVCELRIELFYLLTGLERRGTAITHREAWRDTAHDIARTTMDGAIRDQLRRPARVVYQLHTQTLA